MSFADVAAGRSNGEDSGALSGSDPLSALSLCITQLHTNTQLLGRLLGGAQGGNSKGAVAELQRRNGDLIVDGSGLLAKLGQVSGASAKDPARAGDVAQQPPRVELTAARLARDFNDSVKQYRDVIKAAGGRPAAEDGGTYGSMGQSQGAVAVSLESAPRQKPISRSAADEFDQVPSERLQQQKAQLLLEDEAKQAEQRALKSNEHFILQREEAMRSVHESIEDVNVIFKDLATLIGQQSEQVEQVETNVANARTYNRAGEGQILRKERRERSRRKFFFWALAIMAFAIALFVLVLLR